MPQSTIQYIFYAFSMLALLGALGTILSKNPIHSVIYLILTFFSLSAHYVLMNAQFLAVVNIIVYAGAIMVLFLFVIMFLNLKFDEDEMSNNRTITIASFVGIVIGSFIILMVRQADIRPTNPQTYDSQIGMTESLGKLLYKDYLLPFELISILFLVAMVGAVLLGSKEKGERDF